MTEIPHYELTDLVVCIDRISYEKSEEMGGNDTPHCFHYFVTIYNNSEHHVQLTGRKWIIIQVGGKMHVFEGEALTGEKPIIESGESFSYHSYHALSDDAQAYGFYYGIDELGRKIHTKIPHFAMIIPKSQEGFGPNFELGTN